MPNWHFNIGDRSQGLPRQLAPGLDARIFGGERVTISVVTLAPDARGAIHHHPEEQWGFLLEGECVRILGDEEVAMKKGDFWQTPTNVPHGIRAGAEGAVVLDIFAPPRHEYLEPGSGFGGHGAIKKD